MRFLKWKIKDETEKELAELERKNKKGGNDEKR